MHTPQHSRAGADSTDSSDSTVSSDSTDNSDSTFSSDSTVGADDAPRALIAPAAQQLRSALEAEFDRTLADLQDLVRIPSIAFPAYDREPVRRSAEAVAELLRGTGLDDVRILSVDDGAPAVVARRPAAPGKPTVLLYAHHDVQPEGEHADWDTAPFEPTVVGDRLFGRGAADDKAGIMAHVTALRLVGDTLGVGVTVFVEGEEEAGSPTFRSFVETHRDLLDADVIVVADSANWQVGAPAVTTSLRGLVDLVVEVRVLEHAVHSGMYGGPVLDALTLLSRLISTLHDDDGEVAVAGLHRGEDPEVDLSEEDFRRDAAVVDGYRLAGSGPLTARQWTRPALSVLGIDAPAVERASNTIVPAARAKISLRLAPGDDPDRAMRALSDHLTGHAPFGARVSVTEGEKGKPFRAPGDSAGLRAVREAFRAAWGRDSLDIGLGGSIPFIADLLEIFPSADILVTGVEDPDSRAHGANESLHLGDFRTVCLAEALLLVALDHDGTASGRSGGE